MGNRINRKKFKLIKIGNIPADLQLKISYKKTLHLAKKALDKEEARRLWLELKRKCEFLFPHCRDIEAANRYYELINFRLRKLGERRFEDVPSEGSVQ
jgi:hypothetical protein